MIAAYFNQAINLVVSILMVPVLLKFLGLGEYILWAMFATFGGATLQIENSIQVLSVRAIAREHNLGNLYGLHDAIRRARRTYRVLSMSVLIPYSFIGFVYFSHAAEGKIGDQWRVEWFLFAGAYALNYFYGANNSILLALGRVSTFNVIGSITRILNFVVTVVLLIAGFSVFGVCISFAISVVTSCSLIAIKARKSLRECGQLSKAVVPDPPSTGGKSAHDIVRYTTFTFAAFALYKGGVLLATSFYPKSAAGSYSLIIQALTLLTAVALVPIQVWLSKLVRAILAGDTASVMRELGRTLLLANTMFALGAVAVFLVGNRLLVAIGSSVLLPEGLELLLVSCAFAVELNIFVMVNVLVTKQQYGFVPAYVACVAVGIGLALSAAYFGQNMYVSLVLAPMVIQLVVSFPLVVKQVCAQLEATPLKLFVGIWRLGRV